MGGGFHLQVAAHGDHRTAFCGDSFSGLEVYARGGVPGLMGDFNLHGLPKSGVYPVGQTTNAAGLNDYFAFAFDAGDEAFAAG